MINNNWILMTEQLPPEEQDVLVFCYCNIMRVWSRNKDNPDDYFWETEYGDWIEKDEVVAWSYLPEPPILV